MSVTTYHFIGIGGIGMSGLAELLLRRGFSVSGSDAAENALTRRLQALGATVYLGHDAAHLGDAQVVVHSTAIKEHNPELAAARSRGLTVLGRGELLARLMHGHFQIAVTGAHGKTSTTAMAAAILRAGGLDPTVVVGALWDNLGSNAVLGRGQYFVAEADESDASFLHLTPQVAVITNIDREHLDFYRDLDHIKETFAAFLDQLDPEALVVAWGDDPHLKPLLAGRPQRLLTYSLTPGAADFWADNLECRGLGTSFAVFFQGREMGVINLPLAGSHYVLNSLAACAAARAAGLEFDPCKAGLEALGRIHRRLEVKGEAQSVTVIDDYGHHPREIHHTIEALAQAFPERRLVVAFQPHRFSRTRALLPEFFPVFAAAHAVFITEIYSAGEPALAGISGRALWEGIVGQGHPGAHFVANKDKLAGELMARLCPGDVVLTLGAGDIWKVGEELLEMLSASEPDRQGLTPGGKEWRCARV